MYDTNIYIYMGPKKQRFCLLKLIQNDFANATTILPECQTSMSSDMAQVTCLKTNMIWNNKKS